MKYSGLISYIRYYVQETGRAGVAAVVLLLVAAGLWLFLLKPQSDSLAVLQTKANSNQGTLTNRQNKPAPVVLTDDEKLEAFFNAFPPETDVPALFRKIFQSATHSKIDLSAGEYTVNDVPGSHLRRFRVTLPIKGPMNRIENFINGVVRAAPSGGLQQVAFKRDKIDDEDVEAKVVFVFFVKGAS